MNFAIRKFNHTVLLACAPFIGLMIVLFSANFSLKLSTDRIGGQTPEAAPFLSEYAYKTSAGLVRAEATAKMTSKSIKRISELYYKTNRDMNAIVITAEDQVERPVRIYDSRITRKIGSPAGTIQSDKMRAQLFQIKAQYFSGYALKVKLKSDKAMRMAIGKDKPGGAETTLAAVNRYGAVAGVNAGGFADSDGGRYPLSTTIVNGNYVGGFEASYSDLFFVGLSKSLKLIGGEFSSRGELDKEQPEFGASFVPMLRKNGVNLPIPLKWQINPARAPRTVIANYKDDQLLFLVIDGRNENGSSGATLAEMQILLSRFGAVDAYNLDGGGSSTLVFNGRVINHPSDGQLRPLATNFLFFS